MSCEHLYFSCESVFHIESSWSGISHLNSSDFTHKKVVIKNKGIDQKKVLNITKAKNG